MFSFGAVIALSGVLGAAESVASDLRSNYTGEQSYSTGQIIGHAIVNASTAACLAWASGPSDGIYIRIQRLERITSELREHLQPEIALPSRAYRRIKELLCAFQKMRV